MNEYYRIFFELLQVALGVRKKLSINPDAELWQWLMQETEKQSLSGIAFYAVERLAKGQWPRQEILFEWVARSEQIEGQNRKLNETVVRLFQKLKNDGFDCCLLKGQGNAVLYDKIGKRGDDGRRDLVALRRISGDIDVWMKPVDGRYKKDDVRCVIRYARENNSKTRAVYHHVDYGDYNGTEVEMHFRPSFMNNLIYNRRLQKWFLNHAEAQFQHMVELPDEIGMVAVPTMEFNMVFQLSHIYNHLLHEGIGLRQIIDYYYLLKSDGRDMMDDVSGTLKYLGLWKIAGAVMWILHEKLGLDIKYLIAPMNEKLGRVLLTEIVNGGNFGFYDKDNIKANSPLKKNVQRLKRDMRMVCYFPSECLWEPFFRVYHYFWRLRYN